MSEHYAGRQIVGMDLHRRRSVLVRITETGQHLETVRISNDPEYLAQVMARAGEAPEVVLQAAYGWRRCREPVDGRDVSGCRRPVGGAAVREE